jgi:fumarylacetoacetase
MTATTLTSWVASANDPASDFPIQNLPYGVFRYRDETSIGVAIGDRILDVRAFASEGLLSILPDELAVACSAEILNPLMSLGRPSWAALRQRFIAMLDAKQSDTMQLRIKPLLVPMRDVKMQLPVQIGDYTDFYASVHHAARVGELFRPDSPLLPNYKYVPIGYHGRASSIVVSGHDIVRPSGQTKSSALEPTFGPTHSMDFELEVGVFVGPGNSLGHPIPIAEAEQHIFGLCLVNDWSARDIQSWEYQPLGPFLGKSFATTISPWIIPMEALAPYRVPATERAESDPHPLPYLSSPVSDREGIDLTLEVYLQSRQMRQTGALPVMLSKANLRDLYWTIAQLLTHHTSNGCNLRPGDLLATGTISGPGDGSEGCMLEKKIRREPIHLPSGELRSFLEDGDQVVFRAFTRMPGLPRIGFGECIGTIVGAVAGP